MMVLRMGERRTTDMAISSCGCGAGVSILTGNGEASYNSIDEESIVDNAS
jgi:hypothetical protein